MAKELSVNKNTQEIYEFYKTKLIDPKSLKGKNVLVLELGNITYIDEIKKYAKNVCVIDRAYNCFFGDVFENINTLEIQIKNFLEKNKMPKFDLSIMNPPYEHNLHLDILKIISKNSKRVINISPVKWKTSIAFIENTSQRKIIEEYSDIFANLQSLNIVGTCKSIFGTDDSSDIAIYEVYKSNITHTAFEYISSKEDILTKKMLEKFKKNILDITTKTVQSKNFFRMPVIYGNEHQYWLKKICSDDFNRYWKKDVGEKHCKPYISFNTKNEGLNFHKSLLTKTIRFVHYMCRHNSNVILNAIPWLEDYTKIWDDKRLCSYFGITGYIDDEHAKKGSEWEIILNTMKE